MNVSHTKRERKEERKRERERYVLVNESERGAYVII